MNKIFTVLSGRHQDEVKFLDAMVSALRKCDSTSPLYPSLISRLSWLEYQAEIKARSIVKLCQTGR
jgi:hypothetical protein